MASRKIKLLLAGLALSLMMTTGVQAAQEQENTTQPVIQEETAVEDTEEETDLSKGGQDTTGSDDMNETESAEESENISPQPADQQETEGENIPAPAEQETGAAPAALAAGWNQLEGGIQYCTADERGEIRPVTGWQDIDGKTFYFDGDGYLETDWLLIGGRSFYFKPDGEPGEVGAMALGWQDIEGRTFYFKKTGAFGLKGAALTGVQNIGSRTYYFEKSGDVSVRGEMKTGWQDIDGKTFFFKRTGNPGLKGAMLTGWQNIDSQRYYFKKTGEKGVKGVTLTGIQNIGSRTYFFAPEGGPGEKGAMEIGWQEYKGKTYYLKKTGEVGVKGAMLTGFQNIGKYTYYFKKTGAAGVKGVLLTGRQKIGSQYYCFKETGGHGVRGELCDTWEWLLDKYQEDDSTRQLLFIQYTGGSSAKAVYYSKSGSSWKKIFTTDADVGSNGIDKVREGDRKTPTGTYTLTGGFGIQPDPGAVMDYVQVNKYLYWCGDSAYYNTMVDVREHPHTCSGEHLIDYKGVYDYAMPLDYNLQCIIGKGSAIFLHCKGNTGSTGGCIGISRSNMIKVLQTAQEGAKICIYPE